MRNALLKSSPLAALLIASSFAYAQAPSDSNRNEPKNEKSEKAAPPKADNQRSAHPPAQKGAAEQNRQSVKPETNRAGNERPANRNAEESKRPAATTGQAPSQPGKPEQKADQKSERNDARDARRKNAEERRQSEQKKNEPAANKAERSQQDKAKSTAAPPQQQDQQKGAATQAPAQGQQQQPAAAQSNAPASNSAAGTSTQQPASSTATNANAPRGATTATNANQIAPQTQVQISETISRTRVAPPQRNLNIAINVGTVVPGRVHFYPLPREIWSIEPRYRGYDYFTTEENIVIVEPRSHRVVSMVPRDPSRARAQLTGARGAQAAAGGSPCQVMRRDPASGQLSEVRPETVGSGASNAPLSVTVQTGNNQMSQPVSLDARAGQIVVATQGNGDCQITIEPQPR